MISLNGTPEQNARQPQRMCVVCRTRQPKEALSRHVRAAGTAMELHPALDQAAIEAPAGFIPDPAQRLPGRGYYICREASCRQAFLRYGARRKKREG